MGSWLDRTLGSVVGFLVIGCLFMIGGGIALPSATAGGDGPSYEPMAGPAAPMRLVVPALRIKAPVQKIEVDSQAVLDPPRNASDVGWWQRSARPGAARGQTVLTGHTVHTGGGAMDHLGRLEAGQIVKVVTRKGTMVYRATRVVTWSKAELAQRSQRLFNQQRGSNRLVLITCSGWTGSEYTSNVIVFADPLGVRA
jgi:LPXTG-site transpeptidase (sortase) family protein